MSKNAQQHVFEAFYTTAKKSAGIGLGMSIVHNLVSEKLHGKISFEPIQKGAKFTYSFPIQTINEVDKTTSP